MTINFDWTDKVDNIDDVMAEDVNSLAKGIQDLEENKVDKEANKRLMTNAEGDKLGGIQDNAQVNVRPDWNATSGTASIANKPEKFPPTSHAHDLEDIEGLNEYELPVASSSVLGGIKVGSNLSINESGVLSASGGGGGGMPTVIATGTAGNYFVTIPGVTEYYDGLAFWVKLPVDSIISNYIKINNLDFVGILQRNAEENMGFTNGALEAGAWYLLIYNDTLLPSPYFFVSSITGNVITKGGAQEVRDKHLFICSLNGCTVDTSPIDSNSVVDKQYVDDAIEDALTNGSSSGGGSDGKMDSANPVGHGSLILTEKEDVFDSSIVMTLDVQDGKVTLSGTGVPSMSQVSLVFDPDALDDKNKLVVMSGSAMGGTPSISPIYSELNPPDDRYYTKGEIDGLIGDIESLLEEI